MIGIIVGVEVEGPAMAGWPHEWQGASAKVEKVDVAWRCGLGWLH